MKIFVPQTTRHISPGTYEGRICGVNLSNEENFIWFHIDRINGIPKRLNTSLSIASSEFMSFVSNMIDESSHIETDEMIDKAVKFSVTDAKSENYIYSKLEKIAFIN